MVLRMMDGCRRDGGMTEGWRDGRKSTVNEDSSRGWRGV